MILKIVFLFLQLIITCGCYAEEIQSIVHLHRYFLQEFLDLNIGVITVEHRGINGNAVDVKYDQSII